VSPPAICQFGLGKMERLLWPPPRRGIARMSTREPIAPVVVDLPAAAHGVVVLTFPDMTMRKVMSAERLAKIRV
jgi:hypothetical protein